MGPTGHELSNQKGLEINAKFLTQGGKNWKYYQCILKTASLWYWKSSTVNFSIV